MILHQQIEALEQEAHALEANETLLQDKEDAIMRRCLSITHHLLQHTKRVLCHIWRMYSILTLILPPPRILRMLELQACCILLFIHRSRALKWQLETQRFVVLACIPCWMRYVVLHLLWTLTQLAGDGQDTHVYFPRSRRKRCWRD